MSLSLRVTPEKYNKLAAKSFVYINPADFQELCQLSRQKLDAPEVVSHGVYAQIKGIAFSVMPSELLPVGQVYFNMANRQTAMVPFNADVVRARMPHEPGVVCSTRSQLSVSRRVPPALVSWHWSGVACCCACAFALSQASAMVLLYHPLRNLPNGAVRA